MSEPNWQEFFENLRDYKAEFQFYECVHGITAESLYQAFKARFLAEISGNTGKGVDLAGMSQEQRLEHFEREAELYCLSCGAENGGIFCQCENDE
jgi:hypothetical protein